jgi:hypothetical protein
VGRWLFRPGLRGPLVAQTSETDPVERCGVTSPLRPKPVEESGLADLASSEVVPRDFACHAEGRGVRVPSSALSRSRAKAVFAFTDGAG